MIKYVSKEAIEAERLVEEAREEFQQARQKLNERRERQSEMLTNLFEEKFAKKGDRITTKNGQNCFFIEVNCTIFTSPVVRCFAERKDGTPSKTIRDVFLWEFVDEI